MKSVLKQEYMAHYVSDADIIRFIDQNSDMGWNPICNYVVKHHIVGDNEPAYWERSSFINPSLEEYNEHQIKWIGGFFEAHPFIERMYVVFDD